MKNSTLLILATVAALFFLLTALTAKLFLQHLHPQAATVLSLFIWMLLTPQLCRIYDQPEKTYKTFAALLVGVSVAMLITGGCIVSVCPAGAFVLLTLALSDLLPQKSGALKRTAAAGLTAFFFTSFLWTGRIFSGAFPPLLAVWLSPQAMLSAACGDFSFAHLPDVYNIWLGPVAPLPADWWGAMNYYLIPALALLELKLIYKRIWRNA